MKVFKLGAYFLAGILVFSILGIETLYLYTIDKLGIEKLHTETRAPQSAKDILWVSLGGKGEIRLEETSATEFVFDFVSLAYSDYSTDHASHFSDGSQLAHEAGRLILSTKERKRSIDHHLDSVMIMIWLTRNTEVTSLVGFILENSYYGQTAYSFDEAAKIYFNKNVSELSQNEVVYLISLLKAPSMFSCNKNRHMEQANLVFSKLQKNWPQKYGSQSFTMPQLVENESRTCEGT